MAPKRARTPPPSSPQTSTHLYLLTQTQSQDQDEVDQPRQDDEDGDIEPVKKRARARREWAAADELTILDAVLDYRRKHKKPPERTDNVFFDHLAQRLQDSSRQPSQVKDKVKSLERRYFSSAAAHRATTASGSSHAKRLSELSAEIWGVLPLARDDDNARDDGRRAQTMEDKYPLVAHKVEALVSVQPAARRLFRLLGDSQVSPLEKKLEEVGWSEMRVERSLAEMLHRASEKKKKAASKKKKKKKKASN